MACAKARSTVSEVVSVNSSLNQYVASTTEIPRAALPASLLPRYAKEADSQFAIIERGRDLETGAEGATAPETLRQKDRIDSPNHLESGF